LKPLSRAAGMMGTVIGIDNDVTALAQGRKWASDEALHNVWLFEDDATATQLPRGCYDLVHARFLLAPTGHDEQLLKEMTALARPGGVVAIQEPDSSSWNCHPRRVGWADALKPAIQRAFRAGGGDLDAGQRIYSMLAKAGLQDVQVRAHVIALPPGHPYRHLPVQFATSLRDRILAGGLLSERQLEAAVADCTAAANDAGTVWTTFTLMQAWGRKPR
jgi:SAM-dependent methyltransferase